jgi:pimeloyl-ACP methyl ester carboxylesterase
MPKLQVGEHELHYERSGSGAPLLLIQGMSGTRLTWGEPFLAPLRESFEVIVFDNRGIGLSGPATRPFSIVDLAEDTAALLEQLDLEDAHVVGISMGGMIAQELALARPERLRSLTLGCTYCGGPGSELMPGESGQKLMTAMASGDREQAIRAMYEINLSPAFRNDESHYAAFREMAIAGRAAKATIELQAQAIFGHDTSSRLGEISTPTLIIHGTEDAVLPYANGELIASLMAAAQLKTFEGTGHMVWWEQPERSAELIREHALAAA